LALLLLLLLVKEWCRALLLVLLRRHAVAGEGITAAAAAAAPTPQQQQRHPPPSASFACATKGHEGTMFAHDAQSSGAAVIARGAQTVWPSPPVWPSPSACPSPNRLLACPSPTSQSDVARTCDSTATQLRLDTPHLRLTSHLRLTCDSLSPALSKVVTSASDESRHYRLHPKAIVSTAYKSKGIHYRLPPTSPTPTSPRH